MKMSFRYNTILIVCSALFLFGCALGKMRLHPDLKQDANKYEIEIKPSLMERITGGGKLKFGPHISTEINKSSTDSGFSILGGLYTDKELGETISFTYQGEDNIDWNAKCDVGKRRNSIFGIILDESVGIKCEFLSNDSKIQSWTFKLDGQDFLTSIGILKNSEKEIRFLPCNDLEGSSFGTDAITGYQFEYSGKTVAAVQLIYPPTVWIANSQPREIQSITSAVSSALILNEVISREW